MNKEEKIAITQLAKEYSNIFHTDDKTLTFTNEVKHHIRTKDEIPIYTKTYRYPEIHRNEVKSQVDKMLQQKIIQPSHSPWSSPVWIVPKKLDASGKNKWGIVIDYRKLNEKTIDDKYPIPNIIALLDKLGRCQYFTTLDLASGFHQIEMNSDTLASYLIFKIVKDSDSYNKNFMLKKLSKDIIIKIEESGLKLTGEVVENVAELV